MMRLVLALAVLAGLMLSAGPRSAPPIAADSGIALRICETLTLDRGSCGADLDSVDLSCALTNVDVTASAVGHRYAYVVNCDGFSYHVMGTYVTRSTTSNVQEKLRDGDRTIETLWSCTSDPWGYTGNPPACQSVGALVKPDGSFDLAGATYPLSMTGITGPSQQTLSIALQNALQ